MFIKLKDFVCSSKGSISVLSADITPKWHRISTKSADINKLVAIWEPVPLKEKYGGE